MHTSLRNPDPNQKTAQRLAVPGGLSGQVAPTDLLADDFVWVRCYLKEVKAADELYRLYHRFIRDLVLNSTESELSIDALWAGHRCLRSEAEESCRQATNRGQLLFLVVA